MSTNITASKRGFQGLFSGIAIASLLFAGTVATNAAHAQEKATAVAQQVDDASKTYLLKRVYKKGEVNRYKYSMNMTMTPPGSTDAIQVVMKMISKESVKSAEADGSYSVTTQFESMVMNVMGMERDMTSSLPITTRTRDKNGKITTKSEGGDEQTSNHFASMEGYANLAEKAIPSKSVKIGEEWEIRSKVPAPDGSGEVELVSTSKLLGKEDVDGVKALKISTKVKTTGVVGSTQESVIFIEEATGRPLKMTMDGDIEAQGIPMKMKMTMKIADREAK